MPTDRDARLRLEAGGCAVEVAPAVGGRIAALEVHGWDVLRRDGWTDREWGSFVMAPWVGRLRDARVRWRGREWAMPATQPPHALHGTVLDGPWTVVAADATTATLETTFGDAWPFEASIARHVELHADRLVDRLTVHAAEPMPLILGWHPWFRRHATRPASGPGEPQSGAVEIVVEARRRVDLDEDGLPTGSVLTPRGDPRDDVLLDLSTSPVIRYPGGPTLRLLAEAAAAWVVYTAHPDGVCVEPVSGLPDGLNGGPGGEPPVVRPGHPIVATFEIAWDSPRSVA